MKKILSLALAAVMSLSLGAVAFAAEDAQDAGSASVDIQILAAGQEVISVTMPSLVTLQFEARTDENAGNIAGPSNFVIQNKCRNTTLQCSLSFSGNDGWAVAGTEGAAAEKVPYIKADMEQNTLAPNSNSKVTFEGKHMETAEAQAKTVAGAFTMNLSVARVTA